MGESHRTAQYGCCEPKPSGCTRWIESLDPLCVHSHKTTLEYAGKSSSEVLDAIAACLDEERVPNVSVEEVDRVNGILYALHLTPGCKWKDRLWFRVIKEEGDKVVVEAFGSSTNCCPTTLPYPFRALFSWLLCYSDNRLNKQTIQKIFDATK